LDNRNRNRLERLWLTTLETNVLPVMGFQKAMEIGKSRLGILYFGNDWFAENRTSSHHVARRLAKHFPLLYVESPGLRAPKASSRDWKKLWKKLARAIRPPAQADDQLWVLTNPQIPFRRLPFVNRLNCLIGKLLIARAVKRLGLRRFISWFTIPHPGALAHHLGEELVVYYCTDDYSAYPDIDSQAVARMDDDLSRRADQIFVCSPTLFQAKSQLNAHVANSPHGVDVALFRKASEDATPLAEGAKGLPRPVIGFFGLVEAWIDLGLLTFLAQSRPRWTFLMIGRLAVDPGELKNLKNVVFAGPQPYTTLPNWAKAFDVAIIPYHRNRQVMNANPLKLREYLATGKPVVAVSTPEIDKFREHVYIASDREEFLQHLERALAFDATAARNGRIDAVSGMSWDARVDAVIETIWERMRQAGHDVPVEHVLECGVKSGS
jgi:glycosyltransferase involved in cell wall biosynthesis